MTCMDKKDIAHYFSIYDSPEGRRPADRSTSAKKIGPSDRDLMTMDKSESYYFGVLNKIYLQNLLYGWVANHETNLTSILT